jgi:hypothetical protein
MMLEVLAFLEEDMGKVDRPDADARKFYFMRNLLRTQTELYSAIQRVRSNRQFKAMFAGRPIDERKDFDNKWNTLNSHELLKEVRNDVGAHVKESAVKAALKRLPDDSFDYLQVGDGTMDTQYGFASNIVVAMLMKGVTKQERIKLKGSKKFRQLRAYLVLAQLADMCFVWYALDRRIAPF